MEKIKELFASWKSKYQEDTYLKLFKDAGYSYTVLLRFNSLLEDEVQCGISIVVDANVEEVGMDLVKYAMGHIIEEAGDQIKILEKEIEIEWSIVSLLLTGVEFYFGSILDVIGSVPDKMMSFQELNRSILNSKDTPLNLASLDARKENKKNKLIKTLDYLIQQFKDEYIKEIKYKMDIKLEKIDNDIAPYVTITFSVYHAYHDNTPAIYGGTYDTYTSEIKDSLTEELHQISPIDLSNKRDRILFNFIQVK
jgi:hypothetical protein